MERIAREIARTPRADVDVGVRAIVEIEKRSSGYLLSLHSEVGPQRGARTIEGADCHELAEAAILVIALSDAEADDARAHSRPEDASERPKAPGSTDVRGDAPRAARATAGQLGFLVRPELVLEYGLLRRPVLGGQLALGLAWSRYRAELRGSWLYGATSAAGRAIALRLAAAGVSGCALFGAGRARGGPCLTIELGQALGHNRRSQLENRTFWGASGLSGRLLVALGVHLSLVLDAGLMASWGRLRFLGAAEGMSRQSLLDAWWVQLRTQLGLELSF